MTRFSIRTLSPATRFAMAGVAVLVAFAAPACERALQVAPSSSVLVLTAPVSAVDLNSTLTVTATLTTDTGTAVSEGTLVNFASTLGTISPSEVRVSNGRATVTLNSGSTSGTAVITATSGGVSSSLNVRVGSVPERVMVAATTNGSTATIVASVFDSAGRAVSGVPVTFATTSGTLASTMVSTDVYGQASNTLFGTTDAVVTATANGVSTSVAVRFTYNGTLSVNLALSPNSPTRRQNVIFTATVTTPGNQAVFVQRYEWEFSDGVVLVTTGNTTSRAFYYEGTYSATVRVVSVDGAVGTSRMQFYVD